jgi:hypothetical protein
VRSLNPYHAGRFLAAVRGIKARYVAAALDSLLSTLPARLRTERSGRAKGAMAREHGTAMEQLRPEADSQNSCCPPAQ